MISTDKTKLRIRYREIRKCVTSRKEKESRISDLLLESDFYKSSSSVFLYSACGSEISTDLIFRQALKDGKKVAFPYCKDKEGDMEFYFVSHPQNLKSGTFGIKEPIINESRKAYHDEKSICIVPALCFDRKGGRLGYGKGYYDRFLNGFKGYSVGICFEECITDSLMLDEHDKKVNCLISDKKIYIFNQKED